MFLWIIAIFKWIFRVETLDNAIFSLRIAREVLTSKDANNLSKNTAILRKLSIAQEMLDKVQPLLPNEQTEKYVNGINKSTDKKTWGVFTAAVVKDKHGPGKNGIDLGINTDKLGIPLKIDYDPTTGQVIGNAGPFQFNQ